MSQGRKSENMSPARRILLIGILKGYFVLSVNGQFNFTLPRKMTALEGSCVVIPCTFKYTKSLSKVEIDWYQDQPPLHKLIYHRPNSSLADKSFKGRTAIVGKVDRGMCDLQITKLTRSDSKIYFPSISSEKRDNLTAFHYNNVTISVVTEPQPSLQISPEKVVEGENVTITCYVIHSCPTNNPVLKWNPSGNTTVTHQKLKDGGWNTSSVLTYTPVYTDNERVFECSYKIVPGRTRAKFEYLIVMYAPKEVVLTGIPENGNVKLRDKVSLSCTGIGNPLVTNYVWYKDNQAVINSSGKVLEIAIHSESDSGRYRCEAYNNIGSSESPPVDLICVDCQSAFPIIMGVVSGVIFLTLAVMTVVLVMLKKRKKVKPNPHAENVEVVTTNVYMNLQFVDNFNLENPYTALQEDTMSPDYDELKRYKSPESADSPTQPDYVEMFPSKVNEPRITSQHA